MLIPNSIPAWFTITKEAKKHDMEIKINVDPFNGEQTGHIFLKDSTYSFSITVHPKNLVLSIKPYNAEVFNIFSILFEETFRISYQSNTELPFHAEWYFDCEEQLILEQLDILSKHPFLKVLELPERQQD